MSTSHVQNEKVPIVFKFRTSATAASVALVGSWDDWAEQKSMAQGVGENVWTLKKQLPPGRFSFKFVTDGVWITGEQYELEDDGFGGENNVIVVEASKEVGKKTTAEHVMGKSVREKHKVVHDIDMAAREENNPVQGDDRVQDRDNLVREDKKDSNKENELKVAEGKTFETEKDRSEQENQQCVIC